MPHGPPLVLYYLSAAQLVAANKPVGWWQAQGLVPLVGVDPEWFYGAGDAGARLVELSTAAHGDWYATLWVTNNAGACLLWPLEDAAHWTDLCGRLAAVARRVSGLRGFFLDLEYYPATRHLSGGPMDPAKAATWARASPQLRARADQFAAALGGLTLGGTITSTEIARLPGLAQWLKRLAKHGKTWVLGEDFNGADDPRAVARVGAQNVPGFGSVAEARKAGGASWVYQPSLKALG